MLNFVTSLLKKNSFIYNLNAKIKANKTKVNYNKVVDYYSCKPIRTVRKCFLEKVENVFYIGCDYHQDNSGFLQGLSEVFNVKYFTQLDGKYGAVNRGYPNCSVINGVRLQFLLEDAFNQGFKPDMLLMQMWSWRIDVDILKELKKKYGFIIVNIGMDDRHSYIDKNDWNEGTRGLIPVLDLALTCAPECVNWYKKEGVDALFFPEASHKEFFHPLHNVSKIFDVGFIGAKYGIREEIVSLLEKNGVKVKCYGNGWPDGRLPLEDTNKFFNQCEIVLGVGTIGHTRDFYALKLRDFDALMSGAVYVTHKNPDLELLFENGKEIFLADEPVDFVHIIKELLSSRDELNKTRVLAHLKASEMHTYGDRFRKLKQYLESNLGA
ncbi:Uncharacterized protein conserved in bacteria [Shewanella putrefaciens]|uniref:glycosyltransferase family protein n=1 Tax=Shewanella putrefaciens TaxID=24 RepID=UPI000DF88F41|nr:glycosyltransferase [Shewanella putrefaciens]SUJ07353.1 Uncharacterized protein conserved in bacteria [Shewanella putrefaciens]